MFFDYVFFFSPRFILLKLFYVLFVMYLC